MGKILISTLLLTLFLFLNISPAISSDLSRTALLVGNWEYKESPLKNPGNDVLSMEGVLRKLGFKVTVLLNARKNEIDRSVIKFKNSLKNHGGVGLFYYAGHAMQVDGINYIVCIEDLHSGEFEFKKNCVRVDDIIDEINNSGNKFNIVILDACRDNPFLEKLFRPDKVNRSFRGISLQKKVGLATVKAPADMFIAFSTAPGSVASDGIGSNGVYTKYLLDEILTPGLSLEQVFKKVRASVYQATDGSQVPWEHSSLVEDFYFISPPEEKKGGGKRRLFGAF